MEHRSSSSRIPPYESRVPSESWVEVVRIVLPAGDRAPNVPSDTAGVDFVARVRGFLLTDGEIGSEVRIRTLADREVTGVLAAVSPPNPANFGRPVPELLRVGRAARQGLAGEPRRR